MGATLLQTVIERGHMGRRLPSKGFTRDEFKRRLLKARAARAFEITGPMPTYAELAESVKIRTGRDYAVASVAAWFGEGTRPDSEVIRALAAEFGVDYDWLACKTDEGGPKLCIRPSDVDRVVEAYLASPHPASRRDRPSPPPQPRLDIQGEDEHAG